VRLGKPVQPPEDAGDGEPLGPRRRPNADDHVSRLAQTT
jgi:hypothetical protein